MSTPEPQGPLTGTKVLDLTRILAGPLCAQMLGDMGAEVIKVEPPGSGDDTRSWGPPFAGTESAYFLGINRNKRSITLNMAAKPGQEILARLIQQCDVLVENFKAGTLEKWGFTNDWLKQNAPRVIRCSITGYGTDGPKGGLPGYDFILQAESGLMSITGETGGDPMKYGVAIVDITTGLLACNTILAALNARHSTGRGQHVEVSLYESGLFMLANVASNHLVSGRDARRFGNGHPNIVPYQVFNVADGYIIIATGNDSQYQKLCGVLGAPEMAKDPAYIDNKSRLANRAELIGKLTALTMKFKMQDLADKLEEVGVPAGPINNLDQVFDDPHVKHRRMKLDIPNAFAKAGSIPGIRTPIVVDGQPMAAEHSAPRLGEHTAEILKEIGEG